MDSELSQSPEGDKITSPKRVVRDRFRPQIVAGMRLEERDEELLCDLFWQRAMSRSQLQALYFGSVGRCNARLRLLFDHHFVTRYYLPAAPFGAQAVYGLGRAGAPIVARRLEMELLEVKRVVKHSHTPTFLEHTLAIVDVRLALQRAIEGREDVEIERWLAEPLCRHEYDIRSTQGAGRWQKEVFKPDGFVRFYHRPSQRDVNYFLEVDLGHTSSRQFAGKIMMHRRYKESGLFRELYGGESFRTLVVTTGPRRVGNLVELAQEQGSDRFWFTTFAQLEEHGPLGAIWRVPFQEQLVSLT